MSKIQSVLFPKRSWDVNNAVWWLNKHAFNPNDMDETEDYLHFRQLSPNEFNRTRILRKYGTRLDGRKKVVELVIGFGLGMNGG